jgi:hypothetical protein
MAQEMGSKAGINIGDQLSINRINSINIRHAQLDRPLKFKYYTAASAQAPSLSMTWSKSASRDVNSSA